MATDFGGKGSRRTFAARLLREVQAQSALSGTLVPQIAALPAGTLVSTDRLPAVSAGGAGKTLTPANFRTYTLGIVGGTATIPENLIVDGNFTHNGILTYLAQGTTADARAIVGAGSGVFGAIMTIRAANGYGAGYRFNNGTDLTTGLRWQVYKSGTVESGGGSGRGGADYLVRSYDNSGANFREDLNINRITGAWVTAGPLAIVGAFTGATTGAFGTSLIAPLVNGTTRVTSPLLGTTTAVDVVFDRNSVTQLTLGSLLATFAGSVDAVTEYRVAGTKVVGAQGATITDPTGGLVIDAESRTAINALIDRLQAHGLIA